MGSQDDCPPNTIIKTKYSCSYLCHDTNNCSCNIDSNTHYEEHNGPVYVGNSATHANTNACASVYATHDTCIDVISTSVTTTDISISALNSSPTTGSTKVDACNSDYAMHDTNLCKRLRWSTDSKRTVVSISTNVRCYAITKDSTDTHDTTGTNNSISTAVNLVQHEAPSCNTAVSIGRTRSGDIFGSILNNY